MSSLRPTLPNVPAGWQHERRRIEPAQPDRQSPRLRRRGRARSSAGPGRCRAPATAPTAIAIGWSAGTASADCRCASARCPDSCHPLTSALAAPSAVGARQLPDEVHDPVVLGMEVGETLVVAGNELRHRRRRGRRRVGEERRVLRRVLGLRPRVGRLHLQAVAPALPHLDDERLVPGVAVARLHFDRRESSCSGASDRRRIEQRAVGQRRRRRDVQIGVAPQVPAARTRVAERQTIQSAGSSCCTFTFHMCTRGYCDVVLDRPDRNAGGALERRHRERRDWR